MPFLDKAGVSRLWMHIIAKLNTKIDREDGKGLSTNDYTDEEKSKLEEVYTRVSEGDIPTSGGGGGAVESVNGKTGVVELTSEDVGAQPKTLVVTLTSNDDDTLTASHSASEIAAHVANGGDACIIYNNFMYQNDGGNSESWWFVSMRPIVDVMGVQLETEYIGVYDDKHTTFNSFVTVGVDDTLTISGQAADAKAVGDALARVANNIPTDDHINDLINTALGVIENGTY